ncbi:MAG TPA: YceH family protein [Thermoanaerobaculia bacterium]|nr:YceH family protein [Thermoanaerobaculia bacterium]
MSSSVRIPRPFDAIELRVLGSLLEKEQTTPEAYPLTVNALIAACNQKTNREPVTDLTEGQVWDALERLRHETLVWRSEGARTERWQQSVSRRWGLDSAGKALMTLLLLRGPQTLGELRTRSERMHAFHSLEEVEAKLRSLAGDEEPLVIELPRRPGQKEIRWAHRVGDPNAIDPIPAEPVRVAHEPPTPSAPPLSQRVTDLEKAVADLTNALAELKAKLGEE